MNETVHITLNPESLAALQEIVRAWVDEDHARVAMSDAEYAAICAIGLEADFSPRIIGWRYGKMVEDGSPEMLLPGFQRVPTTWDYSDSADEGRTG